MKNSLEIASIGWAHFSFLYLFRCVCVCVCVPYTSLLNKMLLSNDAGNCVTKRVFINYFLFASLASRLWHLHENINIMLP